MEGARGKETEGCWKEEDAMTREIMAALYIVSRPHVILSKTAKQ